MFLLLNYTKKINQYGYPDVDGDVSSYEHYRLYHGVWAAGTLDQLGVESQKELIDYCEYLEQAGVLVEPFLVLDSDQEVARAFEKGIKEKLKYINQRLGSEVKSLRAKEERVKQKAKKKVVDDEANLRRIAALEKEAEALRKKLGGAGTQSSKAAA